MELNHQEKTILTLGKFFTKFKKKFILTGIDIAVSKATKQERCDPQNNIYPLIIRFSNWPIFYTVHWTGKENNELGFKSMAEYITDKNGDEYSMEDIKKYIHETIPEIFNREFFIEKLRVTDDLLNKEYSQVKDKIKAIKLAKELDSSMVKNPNSIVKQKKLKV